ncbi:cytidine deaminase [Acidobacteria bacterium AH-259-L09]|nr:cytidine deaminase [Acidobacteria bacterium AH-259-L09]
MTEKLLRAARQARKNAYAPYSQFQVGAAVLTKDGRIFSGCNVENSTYGLTLCAERVAIFKAISEGYRQLIRVCIVAESDKFTPPCGACRQIIWEFCGDVPILMANLKGERKTVRCAELLPLPFE